MIDTTLEAELGQLDEVGAAAPAAVHDDWPALGLPPRLADLSERGVGGLPPPPPEGSIFNPLFFSESPLEAEDGGRLGLDEPDWGEQSVSSDERSADSSVETQSPPPENDALHEIFC